MVKKTYSFLRRHLFLPSPSSMSPSSRQYRTLATAYPREKLSPRRAIKLVITAGIIIITIIILTSSSVPPAVYNFPALHQTTAAHQPPVQPNSTSGDTKWYSNWNWHNPFSLSVTLDETRSVLPPLRKRPPIYTFYHAGSDKSPAERAAEAKLLLVWRRAWWAQGFRPVILGKAEAIKNPLYETLQGKQIGKSLETEFHRWLAWGNMGTGILANWLVLPMGAYNDTLLSYLRQGEYPALTRYEGLGIGLFVGDKSSINAVLKTALKSMQLQDYKTLVEATEPEGDYFWVDKKPTAIAFYESSTLAEMYKPVFSILAEDKPAGLLALAQLITSHLQQTFLATYLSGLAILNPYGRTNSLLILPAANIAQALKICPPSPIPSSCPPNKSKCTPCSPLVIPITMPSSHSNSTNIFTIGTIPHPYTLTSLLARSKDITVRHIRRETDRDPWLYAITNKTLGSAISGQSRIIPFKETVASEWGSTRSLWITEDRTPSRRDLEWRFGFSLPVYNSSHVLTSTNVLLSSPSSSVSYSASGIDGERGGGGGAISTSELAARERSKRHQRDIISTSIQILQLASNKKNNNKNHQQLIIRDAVEAWNMADTEAWRFVRAYGAREAMIRKKWELEERGFAGGKDGDEGAEVGEEGEESGWGRWI